MSGKQTIHTTKQSKIVILGSSGSLGRLMRPFWQHPNTIWHARSSREGYKSLDILADPDGLIKLFRGATAVICLAGVTPASPNGTFQQNSLLAQACLDAARATKVGRVFLTSTAAVYGRQAGVLDEKCPVLPLSDYGRAKIEMEEMAGQHDQTSTVLRIGNVTGADAILGNWHPKMAIARAQYLIS